MYKTAGNQHPQFTSEIWTKDTNLTPYENKDRVKTSAAYRHLFLDMNTSWSPEGELNFGIFSEK